MSRPKRKRLARMIRRYWLIIFIREKLLVWTHLSRTVELFEGCFSLSALRRTGRLWWRCSRSGDWRSFYVRRNYILKMTVGLSRMHRGIISGRKINLNWVEECVLSCSIWEPGRCTSLGLCSLPYHLYWLSYPCFKRWVRIECWCSWPLIEEIVPVKGYEQQQPLNDKSIQPIHYKVEPTQLAHSRGIKWDRVIVVEDKWYDIEYFSQNESW